MHEKPKLVDGLFFMPPCDGMIFLTVGPQDITAVQQQGSPKIYDKGPECPAPLT